jgi:deoxyribonuclease (pyrimidine dimer)
MTRINVVPVDELTRQHLLAEHREITRIPNTAVSGKAKLDGNYPNTYRLGVGHVRFFIPRLKWLHQRYNLLHAECLARGYNVTYKWPEAVPERLYRDWDPTAQEMEEALRINRERIAERLNKG